MEIAVVALVLVAAVGVLFAHDRLTRKPCTSCKMDVPRGAEKCGHCGAVLV